MLKMIKSWITGKPYQKPLPIVEAKIYRDKSGTWRWTAFTKNPKKCVGLCGPQGYKTETEARKEALDLICNARQVKTTSK